MTSKFIMKLRRKNTDKTTKPTSIEYIKDALISQAQPMFGTEIVDVEIKGLETPSVDVTYFVRKGVKKIG